MTYPLGEEVEMGYAFGKADWDKGRLVKLCQPVIESAFTTLKLQRLVNEVVGKNRNSINLMKRLGFHLEPNLYPEEDCVVGILDNPSMNKH